MLEVERAFTEGERASVRLWAGLSEAEVLFEGGNLRAGLWSREAAQGVV